MQCTSYIPVFHSRDLNVGSSGVSWHPFNSNTNYAEENGYGCDISSQTLNEQYSSHDKVVLRQIIQNHDATFRHQVQELHRLYQKQRELMNEMRGKSAYLQLLPFESNHSLSDISRATSRSTGWPLGDSSDSNPPDKNTQQINLVPSVYSHRHVAAVEDVTFTRNGSYYSEVEFPFTSLESNRYRNSVSDLDPTAGICRDDTRIQFRERNLSRACKNVPEIRPTTHDPRMSQECPIDLINGKNHFFIDLNQPIEAVQQQSAPPEDSGRNSPMVIIDLNSTPIGCFPETKTSPERISTVENETPDEIVEKPDIDLNTDAIPNGPSSPMARMKFIEPVSPENEETRPPRGKCMSLLSEPEYGEPLTEIDNAAAETLVSIFSRGAHGRLSWFAQVVSSFGNEVEREMEKLESGAIFSVSHNNAEKGNKGHAAAGGKRRRNEEEIGGFIEKGSLRKRRAGKKACAKTRRCSTDRIKKSMSSILKQPETGSKNGVLGSWGKMKKREGGVRRRARKYVVY